MVRLRGREQNASGTMSEFLYRVQYFDAKTEDYGGCYEFVDGSVDIDEDDILGKVTWVDFELCEYHLGDDQFDKFEKILETRLERRAY